MSLLKHASMESTIQYDLIDLDEPTIYSPSSEGNLPTQPFPPVKDARKGISRHPITVESPQQAKLTNELIAKHRLEEQLQGPVSMQSSRMKTLVGKAAALSLSFGVIASGPVVHAVETAANMSSSHAAEIGQDKFETPESRIIYMSPEAEQHLQASMDRLTMPLAIERFNPQDRLSLQEVVRLTKVGSVTWYPIDSDGNRTLLAKVEQASVVLKLQAKIGRDGHALGVDARQRFSNGASIYSSSMAIGWSERGLTMSGDYEDAPAAVSYSTTHFDTDTYGGSTALPNAEQSQRIEQQIAHYAAAVDLLAQAIK